MGWSWPGVKRYLWKHCFTKSPLNTRRALLHAMQFLCSPHMVLVGLAGGCYKNSLMRQCHPEHIIEPAVSWPRIRPVSLSARPSIAGPPLTLARLCWLERGEMLCLFRPLLSPGMGSMAHLHLALAPCLIQICRPPALQIIAPASG